MSAPLHLLLAGWSPFWVQACCRLTLPSLVSAGNLGRLDRDGGPVPVVMICFAADKPAYEADPAFKSFARNRPLLWRFVDEAAAFLGDAREAIVSDAFRHAMSEIGDPEAGAAFMLVKAGYCVGDGSLGFVADRLADGASAVLTPTLLVACETAARRDGWAARDLARAALSDAEASRSALQRATGMLGRPILDDRATEAPGGAVVRAPRWHPIGLRPQMAVDPARQSLIDFEIVPEFSRDETSIHHAASSDEVVVLECRPSGALVGSSEEDAPDDAAPRSNVPPWATPWHISNLAHAYRVIGDGDFATGDLPSAIGASVAEGIPALRHPAWLAARSLRVIPPELGREKRYQSFLDGHYRAARIAIEALTATDVVYAGHASHVMAPLLARRFSTALVAPLELLVRDPGGFAAPAVSTAVIIHSDLEIFQSSVEAIRALFRWAQDTANAALAIVESPDTHGGLSGLDRPSLRAWLTDLTHDAAARGYEMTLASTSVEFFDGHPGFTVCVSPSAGAAGPDPEEARPSP